MKTATDVCSSLTRLFERHHRAWLVQDATDTDTPMWPLSVPLGIPAEKEVVQDVDRVRQWVRHWRGWSKGGSLCWTSRRWRLAGTQEVPEALQLDSAEVLAQVIGQQARWTLEKQRYARLVQQWPQLGMVASKHIDKLTELSAADFDRVFAVIDWLITHPQQRCYIRQLPIAGVDSKWLESRLALMGTLMNAIRGVPGSGNWYVDCGLLEAPQTMRVRVLDPVLRAQVGGIVDLTVPVEQLALLSWQPQRVLISENLQTGLALPDMPGTVALMALGYGVDQLGALPWLRNAQVWYWGDLDTHGFGILHRARHYVPHMKSLLMDSATLHAHTALWVTEQKPLYCEALPLLTPEEHTVYAALRDDAYGKSVRLEQERLGWPHVLAALPQ